MAVITEPRVYSEDSPHSFFKDLQLAHGLNNIPAALRLHKHAQEVAVEVEQNSAEGRRVLRETMESSRRDGVSLSTAEREAREQIARTAARSEEEVRATTSATLTGFATPQWLISKFAIYRSPQRAFADQCVQLPLADVGLAVHIPRFTAAASAGAQAEGSSVSTIEHDPTDADQVENVQTIAGQIVVSQQLIDQTRGIPGGPGFDYVVYEQLHDEYDRSLDNYALSKAMGQGYQVTGQSSLGANPFDPLYTDIATAREHLADTNGARLLPTHLFTTPDLFNYFAHVSDQSHRPILTPIMAPGVPPEPVGDEDGDGDKVRKWAQYTGTVLPGLLFWFIDANIPASGSNTQIVVSRPDKILLFEGKPVTRSFVETIGNNLQVVLQYYRYAACVPRYPDATATITGTAYTTSLT